MSQYNELKKLVEAQQREIKALKREKANARGEIVSPTHEDGRKKKVYLTEIIQLEQ